jgi:hypothetical protein
MRARTCTHLPAVHVHMHVHVHVHTHMHMHTPGVCITLAHVSGG